LVKQKPKVLAVLMVKDGWFAIGWKGIGVISGSLVPMPHTKFSGLFTRRLLQVRPGALKTSSEVLRITDGVFLYNAGCPFCRQTNSVKTVYKITIFAEI